MARNALTSERLRELLHYAPATGLFTQVIVYAGRRGARWKAGRVSGHVSKQTGHITLRLDGRLYQASRLAWFYMTGKWPEFEVDHKDTDPANDRWDNLRDVPTRINAQNKRQARVDNATGLLGVSTDKRPGRRPFARINVNGKVLHLGTFDTAQEAHEAYVEAKRRLHPGNTL